MSEQKDPTRQAGLEKRKESGELYETLDRAREGSLSRTHEEKSEASHIAALTRKEHHAPATLTDDEKNELAEYRRLRQHHEAPGQKHEG
eukprot:CAMPEP_0196657746 /NCGR_PEP_ID=MMETSP1086-20130531/25278_1 /TAXON_ID=77921 /ORGANISM="Cyanoptyche  gloeocystis , Strain SAG4.97" /LENGTH=88 /DNA_ID=CAMNT_0041990999 /DNA_START=178 /DNA_END=444 /DNA_ORIENTATION=+